MRRSIWTFGSNRAGRHGRGAALFALKNHGAIYGVGEGLQGNSYGIPTKGHHLEVLGLNEIQLGVDTMLDFAKYSQDLDFFMTRIGCGLAGYKDWQIAPMFENAPSIISLPKEWGLYVSSNANIRDC